MKASEVIQAALDNHYRTKRCGGGFEFMCHAIEEHFKQTMGVSSYHALEKASEVTCHFMPLFEKHDTMVLTNYLRFTNKRYAYYVKRFGQFTPFCVKVRVKFWRDLIGELQEKGL